MCDDYTNNEVDDLKRRLATAEAKLAKAEACCAETLGALESFLKEIDTRYSPFTELDFVVQRVLAVHARSTDCGTGWLSPDKAKELTDLISKHEKNRAFLDDQAGNWERRADKFQAQVKLLVEALDRIHRISKEVSQVTALPTEMQQMADVAKQALAAVKPTL